MLVKVATVFLRETVAPHVVEEEQRPGDAHDHEHHDHEGETTGAVALLAGVDELLRPPRARPECPSTSNARGRHAAPATERIRRSMAQTFASSESSGVGAGFGALAASSAALASMMSFSRQCRHSRPRPKSTRTEEREERRHAHGAEVELQDDEALLGVGAGRALGRQRRQTVDLGLGRSVAQNCTTAYFVVWVNSPFQNCGPRAADHVGLEDHVLGDVGELGEAVVVRAAPRPWASTPW